MRAWPKGCNMTSLGSLMRGLGAAVGDWLQLRPRGQGAATATLLKGGK